MIISSSRPCLRLFFFSLSPSLSVLKLTHDGGKGGQATRRARAELGRSHRAGSHSARLRAKKAKQQSASPQATPAPRSQIQIHTKSNLHRTQRGGEEERVRERAKKRNELGRPGRKGSIDLERDSSLHTSPSLSSFIPRAPSALARGWCAKCRRGPVDTRPRWPVAYDCMGLRAKTSQLGLK